MQSGNFNCTCPAYGFNLKDGELVINETEAAVIRRIFDLYLQGYGTPAISKILNEDGVPRRHGNEKWLPSSINYVLNNERYMGDALLQKSYTTETLPFRKVKNDGRLPQYYVDNSNPPIVSRETFHAAQNLLHSRQTEKCKRKMYPLSGKLRCPECGRAFRHQVVNGTTQWICTCQSSGATDCQHRHVREEAVYEIFTDMVIKLKTYRNENPSLANPKIKHWGYQKGTIYGFENTKAMVLNRDNYTCQCCKGKHKDSKLEVHHIVFRSQGGSDEESNLITLCHTCHKDLHGGKINPKLSGKIKGTLKYATQMNSIRKQLFRTYPDAIETFVYVTKANRLALGIDKKHYYDACTIAAQGKLFRITTSLYKKKCVPDGDFQKTKGVRSEQAIVTSKIGGFRKFDKVRYFGKEYFIKGRMSTGYAILMDVDGKKIDFSAIPKGYKTPKMANLKRLKARSSWMVTAVEVTPNIA